MKNLKNISIAIALLVSVQFSYAQSGMKAPVSYKLKNGMTVIFAENSGTQKVFSVLSFEGANKYVAEKAAVQELVNTILTQQLPEVHKSLSFTDRGINLAAVNADQFEDALAAMSSYITAPHFTEEALSKAKAEILSHISAQDKFYAKSITTLSVQNLKLNDVNAYYSAMANPATAYLTVAGNIKPAIIKSYAKTINQIKVTEDQSSKTYFVANY
jgi:predicted Zn-dependent peptidase